MDLVGIGIVATFLSMLIVSAFAVQAQSPPAEHQASENGASASENALPFRSSPIRILPSTVIG